MIAATGCEPTPCGAGECAGDERRLCAEPPGSVDAQNSCLARKAALETCAPDPCSAAAVSLGVCDEGLRCIPTGAGDRCWPAAVTGVGCEDDGHCADGLQCIPWHVDPAGNPAPDACDDGSTWSITDPRYFAEVYADSPEFDPALFPDAASRAVEAYARYRGVCLPLSGPATRCDVGAMSHPTGGGCDDCQPGLLCAPDPLGDQRCTRQCTAAADCCDIEGADCVGGLCTFTCAANDVPTDCVLGMTGDQAGCCDDDATCQQVTEVIVGETFTSTVTTDRCCHALGTPCMEDSECCAAATCVDGLCEPCKFPGERINLEFGDPVPRCCMGGTPSPSPLFPGPPAPTSPSDPAQRLYCPDPGRFGCSYDDLGLAGEACGSKCVPGSPLPSRDVFICHAGRVHCKPRHAGLDPILQNWLQAARGGPDFPGGPLRRVQLTDDDLRATSWPSHDVTCDGFDDDCDGGYPLGFPDPAGPCCRASTAVCLPAECAMEGCPLCEWGVDEDWVAGVCYDRIPGPSLLGLVTPCGENDGPFADGKFQGFDVCVRGDLALSEGELGYKTEKCDFTAGPGESYCAAGDMAQPFERCPADDEDPCGDTYGLDAAFPCEPSPVDPSVPSLPPDQRVAPPSQDPCPPNAACVCRAIASGAIGWYCTPREESCSKYCWSEDFQPDTSSLADGHPALSCPPQSPYPP